ncbi:GntR family transcriptional regulator [Gordonia jinhuaensis]|uniref:GntR family transcriptional regulator n=1 Tax=Gordonia jinhuaensis TaxID=1517702 RepID=UPI001668586B|nr:GntR family transcriptional regulator [Gordonia jinhuaensis]
MSRSSAVGLIAQLSPIESGSAQTGVLAELRRAILAGGVAPGTPIPVNEVAKVFGVSPIPVREALKTLIGEGLVDHRTNSGYFVARLTSDELREIYFVRGVLERAALAQAVEKMTDDDLALARAEHQALQESTISDDRRGYHRHSRRFHQALVDPCGMPRLLTMFETTWNMTEPFQIMRTVDANFQLTMHADHERMISAAQARDADALVELARVHHGRLESAILATGG